MPWEPAARCEPELQHSLKMCHSVENKVGARLLGTVPGRVSTPTEGLRTMPVPDRSSCSCLCACSVPSGEYVQNSRNHIIRLVIFLVIFLTS